MSEVDDFLEHFGVKGMKWGQRKSESSGGSKPSSNDIKNARIRTNIRTSSLDSHATALSLANSKKEKQNQLDRIHKIAKDPKAQRDIDMAATATRGEKVSAFLIAGPIGNMVVNSQMKAARKQNTKMLDVYGKSTLADYYDKNGN